MNMLTPKKFTGYLFILSVALYGVLYLLFTKIVLVHGMPLHYMLPLLFVFTVLSYLVVVKAKSKPPHYFVYSFMMMSLGRLMVYGGFVFLFAFLHRNIARPFALTFLSLYFVYTAIEVLALYAYFKD